ncbi:MAG TPA: glycerophosphodiester phosphodiesterase [Planctomycetaceae bacterium]|nr:glycerophosphodiester phosphodiesterase [Planctomycetaceae bacterium]
MSFGFQPWSLPLSVADFQFRQSHLERSLILMIGILMLPTVARAQAIVAHRGASYHAPENTLAAFKIAWEDGADAIEGDFYLSADADIVCIHDKDTERTSPRSKKRIVAKTLTEQLRTLDVGAWKSRKFRGERIPLLEEVLATIPEGKKIFVEIKCGVEIVPRLAKVLNESKLQSDQIVVISFDSEVVKATRKAMPEYKVNWLTSYKQGADGRMQPSVSQIVKTLSQCDATGLGTKGERSVVNQEFAKAIKSAGFELHVWTVNNESDAKYFQSLGVDSITTDKPKQIREALR